MPITVNPYGELSTISTNIGGQIKELQSIYTNVGGQLKEIHSGSVFKGTWHLTEGVSSPTKTHEIFSRKMKLPVKCTIELSNLSEKYLYRPEYNSSNTDIVFYHRGEIYITGNNGFDMIKLDKITDVNCTYTFTQVIESAGGTTDLKLWVTSCWYDHIVSSNTTDYLDYKYIFFDYKITFEKV